MRSNWTRALTLWVVLLTACQTIPINIPGPLPSSVPSTEPSVLPSAIPSALPSPMPKASGYSGCLYAIAQADSWVRESIAALGDAGFQKLGCPTGPELSPYPADGRYNYQAFEKDGLCVAWDWSKPKNYVFQNYIVQPCVNVPTYSKPEASQKPKFPIGVWYQPASSMAKWKARGVNTMVGYEAEGGTTQFPAWSTELAKNDLFAIRLPQGDPKLDAADPRLLAWFVMPDEPDIKSTQTGSTPADAKAQHDLLKAAAPNVPLWINFSGGNVRSAARGGTNPSKEQYQAYMSAADLVSHDLYPITGWLRPDWIDLSMPIAYAPEAPTRYTIGWTLETLKSWSGGKPQMSILETGNQNLSWLPAATRRGVTVDEFRGEIWHSIIHGATSIAYFADAFNGFNWDATPVDVAAEMTKQDAVITANADALSQGGQQVSLPVPFEQAKFNGLTVTLNFSHGNATLNGIQYGPYEVRIVKP